MTHSPRILVHARGRFTPDECDFWQRLNVSLSATGIDLWLLAHNAPQSPIACPHARVPNGLDAAAPLADRLDETDKEATDRLATDGLDAEALLTRERQWRGPESDGDHRSRRLRALRVYHEIYASALSASTPAMVLVWNGEHPQEVILRTLAARAGAHVSVLERGPFAGTIHPDDTGILGASAIALESEWRKTNVADKARWLTIFNQFQNVGKTSRATWWEQPDSQGADALRKRLAIPNGTRIALFLGQVDADAQGFLFGGRFAKNLDAWRTIVDACESSDVFLLGKHHPKCPAPPERYREIIAGRRALWIDDASMDDCLALAGRVCATNSTGLFESLLRAKPCLMLGRGLLSGKRIAHEIDDGPEETVIANWLEGADNPARQSRFHDFCAHLMGRELFTMRTEHECLGSRGVDALAEWTGARLAQSTHYEPATDRNPWSNPLFEESGELLPQDFTRNPAAAVA